MSMVTQRRMTLEGDRRPRVVGRPHPVLRGLLAPRSYSGYPAQAGLRGLILPATASTSLVVPLAKDLPALVTGVHDTIMVAPDYGDEYLEVWLSPLGARRILGVPADEFGGTAVRIEDVVGPAGRELRDRVGAAATWTNRFALIDEFLIGRATTGRPTRPEVAWAWWQLWAPRASIGRIANDLDWSHSRLIANFRRQIGLAPKRAARVMRFEGLMYRVELGEPMEWNRLATDAGYADQAHFTREFKAFTGTTPSAFARHRKPIADRSPRSGPDQWVRRAVEHDRAPAEVTRAPW